MIVERGLGSALHVIKVDFEAHKDDLGFRVFSRHDS
jgi:hypothetical protein